MSNNVIIIIIIDIWSGINEGGWKINNNYDIEIENKCLCLERNEAQ